MKKYKLLCAALALTLSLTACSGGLTTVDATAYVQGLLDETYLGKFDKDYLEMVDLDEEDAQESYEAALEVEYDYFAANFQFDEDYISEDTRDAALDLIAELYQHARYEVKPALKTDTGFTVEVVVQPVNLIPTIVEEYMEDFTEEFNETYAEVTSESLSALTKREREAFLTEYENAWANGILKLFEDHKSELTHLPKTAVIVKVEADAEGYYAIPDNDFANIDALILAYIAPAGDEEKK